MRAEAGLTQRETQIAELLAWGAAKKEVADRLSIWYFVISFCLLASTAEAPFWFLFLEVANFANAARIIKRVPPPEDPQDS